MSRSPTDTFSRSRLKVCGSCSGTDVIGHRRSVRVVKMAADCLSLPNRATLAQKVMNSIHVALVLLLTTVTCLAQGQVYFANRVGLNGSILNAPVTIQGTQNGPGPDWSVQLLLQGANGSLTPLLPISTFNPAGPGAAAISSQFWAPKTVDIPGHFAGEALNFVVQAWLTSQGSYDAAKAKGGGYTQSAPFAVVIGGLSSDPNTPPTTPANLTTLKAFSYVLIPEPSTITIELLGAAVLASLSPRSLKTLRCSPLNGQTNGIFVVVLVLILINHFKTMKKAILLGALCATSLQAQVVIDNFETGNFSITERNYSQSFSNPLVQQLGESDVIGGTRMTFLYADDPAEGSTLSVSGGRLNFSCNASTAILAYGDTTGADPSEQLHLNLSNARLSFEVARDDTHAFLGFSLYRNDGSVFGAVIMIDGSKTYKFPLVDASLSDIAGMQVSLWSPQGGNEIDLNSIMAEAPEPSTYSAMFGIGLLGFSILKRYHSRTA